MSDKPYKPGAADLQRLRSDVSPVHMDAITRELREDGWYPRQNYPCGCHPQRLCPIHTERRAVDHYHPETIR